jgi:hypothetical protein
MTVKKIITLALFVTCVVGGGEEMRSHPAEQVHFSAEDTSVKRPVPIPDQVLAILKEEEKVRDGLEDEGIPTEQIPLSWFSASTIHLSSSNQVDLVVMGQGPLRGANVIPFWVFISTTRGYQLVLTASEHDLIVMNTRWRGYREIELIYGSAAQVSSVVCRFNGQRYEGHRTTTETH